MLETYQFKTQCKGDIHSSKTATIILPGLIDMIQVNALTCTSFKRSQTRWHCQVVSTSICGCIWTGIQFCTRKGIHLYAVNKSWQFPLFVCFYSMPDRTLTTNFRSQCRTAVPHCCKGDAASQWENGNFGVSELCNPWTDRL